jgi:hypothetical protein
MNKRQIEKRISLIPDSSINNSYIKDPEYLFLLKKTEKIVTVTYILTDFIPTGENLKKSLKDNVHEALNFVCDFLQRREERLLSVQRIKSTFIKLLTQYNLAHISGYISPMNLSIIKDEIDNLLRRINDLERDLIDEQSPDLKQSLFGVDVRSKRHYKGHDEDNKSNVLKKKPLLQTPEYKVQTTSVLKVDKNNREEKILDILKDKEIVSIKDISELILDCSEKTIQRTLNKMILDGKIRKKGERRWARYSLN